VSEGETPAPSSGAYKPESYQVKDLIQECNHLHLENARLRDLVCWLRTQLEGLRPHQAGFSMSLLILEPHHKFFARKEMEDAWDIVIQQQLIEHIEDEMGESNDE
tara:strand:+ start:497 stop:811 length:315 start_codon:yes stop_codon:yes gene_type:complete